MLKARCFYGIAAAVFAAAVFNSCSAASSPESLPGVDDGRTRYTITKAEAENGGVTLSAERAAEGDWVTVTAESAFPSAWAGEGTAPEGLDPVPGGGGGSLSVVNLRPLGVK
jgi:hypothetical protein